MIIKIIKFFKGNDYFEAIFISFIVYNTQCFQCSLKNQIVFLVNFYEFIYFFIFIIDIPSKIVSTLF